MSLTEEFILKVNELAGEEQSRLIGMISSTVNTWDVLVGEHSLRTARYSFMIGREIDLPEEEVNQLYIASLLHDCGKLAIPPELLYKPGGLNEEEWAIIKLHPHTGAQIVGRIETLKCLAPVIFHHHEFYNGRGYPGNISGEDIPFLARIITVADAYEAMTTDRPFRRGFSHREAVSRLKQGKNTQFDPDIVGFFLKAFRRSTLVGDIPS